MSLTDMDPRYPVGRFTAPSSISPDERTDAIATLAELPEQLRNAVDGLSFAQLSTPYRDGGWTLRQLVHHVADSHMNALIRVKLAPMHGASSQAAFGDGDTPSRFPTISSERRPTDAWACSTHPTSV